MRATVDEKLHATLEQRLGESFKQVADRLEQVHKGLGEMQTLARDVGSLNRVLTNVKTRGIFGEVQLAGPAGAGVHARAVRHQRRHRAGQRRARRIRDPAAGPARATARRCGCRSTPSFRARTTSACSTPRSAPTRPAPEHGGQGDRDPAARGGAQRSATSTSRRRTPPTSRILFVPTEGLYAEALRRPGLMEALQREYKVMLAGPTTLLATLNSLQMGFRTLALEKRSAEVWEVLGAVKTEFGKFGDVLAKTKKKLDEASNTIDQAEVRTRAMARQLRDGRGAADIAHDRPAQRAAHRRRR